MDCGLPEGSRGGKPQVEPALAACQSAWCPLAFSVPDGLQELIHPDGDTIRVEVSGQNDGSPEPGTGVMLLSGLLGLLLLWRRRRRAV